MESKGSAQGTKCVWCKLPMTAAEKELHVSLLGAPGEFHRACFEEYAASTSFDAHDTRAPRPASNGSG
jgi:hypothetical protein